MKDFPTKHTVFFDGLCHLCNGFVDEMILRDGKRGSTTRKFQFAPLQGETAKRELPAQDLQNLETVIVKKNTGEILHRSDAILFCLEELGGPWALMGLLRVLPRVFRDQIYSIVARNRYGWFGQRESCRLPQAHERLYLLD